MTVSAIGIVLDPSEVAEDRTELDINSGAIRIANDGPNWGDAAVAAAIADRKFGSVPVGYRIPNRLVTIPLIVQSTATVTFNQAQTKLQQKVARFQDEGGWLKRTSSDGTTKLYADIVDATLTFPDPRFQDAEGGVVLTLECLPDFYGAETQARRFRAAIERVDSANDNLTTLLLADPDGDTGTIVDRSSNAYTGSLVNGATVEADGLGGEDALSLGGVDEYASFAAPTRRNLCTNPSFETGLTGWTGTTTNWTSAAVAQSPDTFTGKIGGYGLRLRGTKDNNTTGRQLYATGDKFAVTAGTQYTLSGYLHILDAPTNAGWGFTLYINWFTSGDVYISSSVPTVARTVGAIRQSVTATAPVTAAKAAIIAQVASDAALDTVDGYYDGILFEAASSAGAYFDGSGYVNDDDEWVDSDGELCGWLGTAHASASDKGPLANGTTRSWCGVARVSADAGSGVGQTLWGSNLTGGGGATIVRLYNSAGTRQLVLHVNNTTTATWTLTADEIAATAAGQTFAYRLEFNETADTAELQINGLPAVSKASVTAQHGAGQTTVQLGDYSTGTSPFPGKMGPSAIIAGALADAEWTEIAGAAGYSSGDHSELIQVEDLIPGDYPARSRYTFTDTGSQNRQAIVIASQSRTYDSAATAALSYAAEDLTPLGTAAVGTVTGAHGGGSNNAVIESSVWSSETPILSTEIDGVGHMTHWGNYRVFARVRAPDTITFVRFDYSAGDASKLTQGPVVEVSASSAFYIVDLGEIRIPKVPVGTQQWQGRVIAYNEEGATAGADFAIDKLYFAPTESLSIIRPRVSLSSPPAVGTGYAGFDSFQQSAGALTGESASIGGTWAGAGDADDFTNDGTNKVTRTAVSDASGDASDGRVMSLGSSTYTNVAAALSTQHTGGGAYAVLVLRYTDINNFAAVLYYPLLGAIGVQTIVAGTKTDLGSAFVPVFSDAYSMVTAYVDASGYLTVWTGPSGISSGQFVTTVYSSALATGGTLASGKVGFGDQNPSATASTRSYNYFSAWVPDVDAACLSGKSLSARYDGAWRETADSGVYAPAHVEGVYPRAPASGLEARTCRTLVLPSAGDLGTLPDIDPVGFSVQSHHRATYLFSPEE